jgi:ribonucleoside-diphosphate reductase alpha chain
MNLLDLKNKGEAPLWMDDIAYETLSRGYLLQDETPKQAIKRMSDSVSKELNIPYLSEIFFEAIWKNWLCPSSPIWANCGTERGLPISCNSVHIGDSVDSIFTKNHELAMLSKNGAGVGIYIGDIRGRNQDITGNGKSEGVIPWLKVFETTTLAVSQGGTRKGASASYLPITHPDYEEFIQIRRSTGDHNRRARNMHIGACIDDQFMNEMLNGNKLNQSLWLETLKERVENGEPYLFFNDNVEKLKPKAYVQNNLKIKTSNICNEIYLYTDPDHTFVCCLSSLNLDKWEEWKDYKFFNGMSLPEVTVYFLDGILNEYIKKAKLRPGFEAAVRSAEKGRAVGIGVLGLHSLLQSKMIEMDSFDSMMLNSQIFKFIDSESLKGSRGLANILGEPVWCKGLGIRNTHRIAVAPTASNSTISGGVSAGIEPITSNCYSLKSAKGTFIKKNRDLENLLESKQLNTVEIWDEIIKANGSVKNLKKLSNEEKSVFLTARELNQHTLIKLASQRQKWIDQGQSLNLFFTANASAKYIHEVHLEAWKQGLKGLYYLRSETVLNSSNGNDYRSSEECKACES